MRAGETGYGEIDVSRRRAISRAHTATHLVHQGMRNALGESATQAGSLNAPGRLRFDFNTPSAVPPSVLRDVEQQVNEVLTDDLEVRWFVTSQAEARRIGAMALFGEKYGDQVRVVEVGDFARELCGGTHVARSGQLGLVKILHESSIGSGIRRVEALVGVDAVEFMAKEHLLVSRLAELYRARPDEVAERVEQTIAQLRDAEKELEKLRAQLVLANAGAFADAADGCPGGRVGSGRGARGHLRQRRAGAGAGGPRQAAGRPGGRRRRRVAGRRQGVAGRGGQRGGQAAQAQRRRPGQGRTVRAWGW